MTEHAPELVNKVLVEYRKTRGSPFKTADALNLPIETVWSIVKANGSQISRFKEHNGGYGQPWCQQYLVSRRLANGGEWDNNDPEIASARANYEAGTHLMTTGRDGAWVLLYSIPRRFGVSPKPGFFKTEIVE